MGTMLVLVLTTGVTFLATFSPPGSVAATAEGYLYPSSSPLPPGIPTQETGVVTPTPGSAGDPYHYSSTSEEPLPIAGDGSISAPSSSASIASGAISGDDNMDEIDSTYGQFSTGLPMKNNWTVEETLAQELAAIPIRDPLSVAVPMTVVYVVILLSGLLGNISTCIVIAKNTYMHTATNYYLFSLAMSDLLLLICGLPQEIYHIWKKYPYLMGDTFCVIRGLAAETSANATVLTITAFTVERHKISQLSRVVRMIGFIWVVAFCLALPQAAQFGIVDEVRAWCTIAREIFPYAFEISSCVFFVIPMTIITVLYVLIGLKLRRPRGGSGSNSEEMNVEHRNISNRHSQSHVIRMLVAVVVAFFICWAPFHAQRFMALYGRAYELERHDLYQSIYQGVHYISGVLYYISTCINPILYHIMSNKFRQAFKVRKRDFYEYYLHISIISPNSLDNFKHVRTF
ncbi:Neuropeptide capa receptor, partial [Orchesella cincta]